MGVGLMKRTPLRREPRHPVQVCICGAFLLRVVRGLSARYFWSNDGQRVYRTEASAGVHCDRDLRTNLGLAAVGKSIFFGLPIDEAQP
jgi:hypothetical protein